MHIVITVDCVLLFNFALMSKITVMRPAHYIPSIHYNSCNYDPLAITLFDLSQRVYTHLSEAPHPATLAGTTRITTVTMETTGIVEGTVTVTRFATGSEGVGMETPCPAETTGGVTGMGELAITVTDTVVGTNMNEGGTRRAVMIMVGVASTQSTMEGVEARVLEMGIGRYNGG